MKIEIVEGLAFAFETPKDRYIIERVVVENIYGARDFGGKTVVDVGAHVGSFSVLAGSFGARVIAVEPELRNFSLLRTNLLGNRTDAAALMCAIGVRNGIDRLYLHEENTGCHSTDQTLNGLEGASFQETTTVTIGDVFDHYKVGECSLLKVDAEGAETIIVPWVVANHERVAALSIEFHRDEEMSELTLQLSRFYKVKARASRLEWSFIRK